MSFSESVIKEVKEKSAFMCCRCRAVSVEVHHIIPQKDGGSDTIDNAAPLCPSCHSSFGDNQSKQKEIKQMRDWWYEQVKNMYSPMNVDYKLLENINSALEILSSGQNEQKKALNDLKMTLKTAAINAIDQMTPETAMGTASGIANATISPYPSPSPSHSYFGIEELCANCMSGNVKQGELCPICGNIFIL